MPDWIQQRGHSGAGGWIEQAVKLIIAGRTGVLVLTLAYVPQERDNQELLVAALVVAAAASFFPLRHWERVGPVLVRHPVYLAAEIVLSTVVLLLTGVENPFFYYTLGTALLAGLLYGWSGAALFSAMLIGVYFWVADVREEVGDRLPETFQALVGSPALYLFVALAGAGARGLLDRQAEAEMALAEQEREAAAQRERARLARDLHDSLAKTVHGIGFAALALSRRIERDPEAASRDARLLAEDAKRAAQQARDLIAGLRSDQEAEQAPTVALRAEGERWAKATGVPVHLTADDVDDLPPVAARELAWILKEALRNVERHAQGTTQVTVRVRRLGRRVVLTVGDDGPGFEVPDDLDELSSQRHYGLVGMRERARVAGGDLMVESAPGEGVTVSAWVPAAGPETPVEVSDEAAPQPRSVPGYTWQ